MTTSRIKKVGQVVCDGLSAKHEPNLLHFVTMLLVQSPNQKIWRARKQAQANGTGNYLPYFFYTLLPFVIFRQVDNY